MLKLRLGYNRERAQACLSLLAHEHVVMGTLFFETNRSLEGFELADAALNFKLHLLLSTTQESADVSL